MDVLMTTYCLKLHTSTQGTGKGYLSITDPDSRGGGTPIYGVTGCAALKGMFFDLPVSEWVCIFTEFEPRVSQWVCIFDGFDPKVSERVCILTLS